jgi:hypothetical protein
LPERFKKFANAFFVSFCRPAPNGWGRRCRSSRFIFGIRACSLDLARCSRQQLKQQRDRDQQKEKQIFKMGGNHLTI